MRAVDVILKKRQGLELTGEEISFLIHGYCDGTIADYQMSAWAMAVFFQGMTAQETSDLTMAMVDSGETVDLSQIAGIKVDKHSTGGVGDTTTLVLAPLVASIGVPVAKMSGRGLGHTGGTIDKLESIPGFSVESTTEQFVERVNSYGIAIMGQSDNITPADKKLYSLRDVTATVESIPLIASSIMSKKLAAGADRIVLDVKTGNGAFMQEKSGAVELARTMVEIGQRVGKQTIAIVSDMSRPLGSAIGNALEVAEAIETLKGKGSRNLAELCLRLGAQMAVLAKVAPDEQSALKLLEHALNSGQATRKMQEFIRIHGGDERVVEDLTLLPQAQRQEIVSATRSGYISGIAAMELGTCAMLLGAGRQTKASAIDLAVGIKLHHQVGDYVKLGEALATLYVNDSKNLSIVAQRVAGAFRFSEVPVTPPPLIYETVSQ
ncbi:MAG: deoA [Bacilli bacterium]|nr:deoA [Bacilli bacterium]